jgi:cell division protease FtsH
VAELPPETADDAKADHEEARQFALAFRKFLQWVHSPIEQIEPVNEVVALVADALGPDRMARSVVHRDLSPFEHVNLQMALDAWAAEPDRSVEVQGITSPPHMPPVSLQQLVAGEGIPPLRLSAPALVDVPSGPHRTLACTTLALLLVDDARSRYVLMVNGPAEQSPGLQVEIAGLPVGAAQEVLDELDELRSVLNVYRGHLLDVTMGPMGMTLSFLDPPELDRAAVILPEAVLQRVERHAVAIAQHREALLASGQHLKRGLLLYGPPGTGKTHTTRYLLGRMANTTRLVLTGRTLGAISSVADLARDLAPAVIVLEDVDLVAQDRAYGHTNPVLFDLLDAMDGAAPDADLLFLLTTNRVDLLETALAARPGRVDVAVHIALPDADARARLLALYSRAVDLDLSAEQTADAVERTDGVTASFLKELVRRAVVESVVESGGGPGGLPTVTAGHLTRALDDLLDSTQSVTRSLLGVGVDPAAGPPEAGVPSMPFPTHQPPGRYGGPRFVGPRRRPPL